MPRVSARRTCSCLFVTVFGALVYTFWPQGPNWVDYTSTAPIVVPGEWIEVTEQAESGAREEEEQQGQVDLPPEGRPWFMTGGTVTPTNAPTAVGAKSGLWPGQKPVGDDRITDQLMYKPPLSRSGDESKLKTILIYNGLGSWAPAKPGRSVFSKCPVDTCKLTASKSESRRADAILYKDHFVHPGHPKVNRQVWILYLLECPYHTQHVKYNDVFNWTATYRRDSDVVAPYEKFVYYDPRVRQLNRPLRNYALNKTKQVAWFVSNCGARNGRLQYAHELQRYISVDIFGACGIKKCPRSNQEMCFEMLDNEYKFYLAFENSNCKDYITEKFFVNGLGRDVLPIVMGARPEDYLLAAPEHSYIHVDDFDSPRSLAEFLLLLDKDDESYNSYFRWKGTGEFINTHFFCRLCAMLHDDFPAKSYRDINEWWRGPGTCTSGSWRKSRSNWAAALARPKF
ncbi:unnamed protein product [Nesidiocoris tenuis]|uniref:Fucosyltransferase n=1 Tax=Nesidiocoris tenuis TaxID=355587 RepID=A0A6H5H0L5_9HEMI|nr:unnamed protein product [Nesidiocoris tenuis]